MSSELELKVAALLESISESSRRTANQIADLRVEITLGREENARLTKELEIYTSRNLELEAQIREGEINGSVSEEAAEYTPSE